MLNKITPTILTYNEEANIERTLSRLSWAEKIIVVDSFSDDGTIEILKNNPKVAIHQRPFDSHEKQWNFAVEQVRTEWVLSLDADYVVSDELIEEMKSIKDNTAEDGFWVPLIFCIDGLPLNSSVLPPRMVLFRKKKAAYYQDGHTQILKLDGKSESFKGCIYHDDRKPFSAWLSAQKKYADREAEKLFKTKYNKLRLVDKMRKLIFFLPVIMPVHVLFIKGGIIEGRRGIYYAYLRTLYEVFLAVRVFRKTIK